jgi:hypothetical protein
MQLEIVNERSMHLTTLVVDRNILARDLTEQIWRQLERTEGDFRLEFRGELLLNLHTLSTYNLPTGATLTFKSKNVQLVTVELKYSGQYHRIETSVEGVIGDVIRDFMSRLSLKRRDPTVIHRGITLSMSDPLPSSRNPIVLYLVDIAVNRNLRVLSPHGEIVQITSSIYCQIQDFKQQLQAIHGFPSADGLSILHNGRVLSETSTIEDCDIGESTVLHVHLIQQGTLNIRYEKNSIQIKVKSNDLIEVIKGIISSILSCPVENQKLIFNTKELKDDLALLNYDIRFGSTLKLEHRTYSIYIMHQDRTLIDLEVSKFDTIASLKVRIEFNEQIPIRPKRLFFNGEQMHDSKSLTSYGIKEHCTLDLVANSDWVIVILQLVWHIVACSPNDPVSVLLTRMATKIGGLPGTLKLNFRGNELAEDSPLSFYGVRCGSKIWSEIIEFYVDQLPNFRSVPALGYQTTRPVSTTQVQPIESEPAISDMAISLSRVQAQVSRIHNRLDFEDLDFGDQSLDDFSGVLGPDDLQS